MFTATPASEAVAPQPAPDFLSPAQYASASGISLSTVWRLLAKGLLPKLQPGGPGCRVLIPITALQVSSVPPPPPPAVTPPDATSVSEASSLENKPPRSRQRGPRPRWSRRR
jgi:hypothetical protein